MRTYGTLAVETEPLRFVVEAEPHVTMRLKRTFEGAAKGFRAVALLADPDAFGTFLRDRGVMLRRTRREVGREIPPVSTIPYEVDCDRKPLEDVEADALELARTVLSSDAAPFERMQASGEIDYRLRQATGLAKAPHVAAFVRLLVESGERVVLYGWHRAVYEVWMSHLRDLGVRLYTGSESPSQKEESRKEFCEGDTKVLVISLRSGAGLDGLQHVTRTVVFGELDWSPGVHVQCIGRVARDGQEEPVTAYYLVSREGSDPVIADVLNLKRGQVEPILDPAAELVEALEVDPQRVKKLAAAFLEKAGKAMEVAA